MIEVDARLEKCGFHSLPSGDWSILIPEFSNMADLAVSSHVSAGKGHRIALIEESVTGQVRTWNFSELDILSNQLANYFEKIGIGRGDPVGIHLGQGIETAVTHLAIYKMGAIACTLSELYGPDTLRHILMDTGLSWVVTKVDDGALNQVRSEMVNPPQCLYTKDIGKDPYFWDVIRSGEPTYKMQHTKSNDAALLMYTSGSTGHPKGMLHSHRVLSAYLPTVRMFYNETIHQEDAVFWTAADWAWVGGWLDLVLPAWVHAQPVVAYEGRFSPESAFGLMQRHGITHSFMTPTALKRLAEIKAPKKSWSINIKVICTGGESLPGEVVRWCEGSLDAVCNEFYGLTEFNHMVGNCKSMFEIRPGSMGKAYPGHKVRLVDDLGMEVMPGEVGEIVVSKDDPTLFLGYWGNLGIPDTLILGEYLRTRDLARLDSDGYFWYQGRNDDLIKSAGYRIGPAEVEDALLKHPSVAEAAVVASPDKRRGSVVKAFIRLREGFVASDDLSAELQQMVKINLAAYKYPRLIEYVQSFPLTSSGKIRRAELRRQEFENRSSKSESMETRPDGDAK